MILVFWLLLPFLGLIAFSQGMFQYYTLENEKDRILHQVSVIAYRLNNKPMTAASADDWNSELTEGMLIRWTDSSGKVIDVLASDSKLASLPPSFRRLQHPVLTMKQSDRVYVMAPVFTNQEQTGVVEIGKTLDHLQRQLKQMESGLMIITVLSLCLTALLGYMYMFLRKKTNVERQKRYLHDISHELRTPLTVIESYAGMMQRWAGNDPKLREEATDVILSEAKRLRRLTTQMLDLSDWEEPGSVPQSVNFDLLEQLRVTASRLSATFNRTIEVKYEAAHPVRIVGNQEQLRQLWIILLDNAIKYSQAAIQVILTERINDVTVSVSDEGIGIPSEELPFLFDRHYRGKGVRRRRGGAGLGLAIARNIVKHHGGDIHLESAPGKGTKAIVTLPKR